MLSILLSPTVSDALWLSIKVSPLGIITIAEVAAIYCM